MCVIRYMYIVNYVNVHVYTMYMYMYIVYIYMYTMLIMQCINKVFYICINCVLVVSRRDTN